MVAIQAPVEKTKVYSSPNLERAVFSAPRGLARRQYVRVRVNDLSQLWPEAQFRQVVLRYAEQFKRDMERQGFIMATAEADVRVSGPLMPRNWSAATNGAKTVKRHVREGPPQARQDVLTSVLPTFGRHVEEENQTDREDFLLEAKFISTRVVRVEHKVSAPDA